MPAEAAAPPATIESPAALPSAPTPAPTPEAATPAAAARPRAAGAPKPSPKATPTPEPTATPPPTPAPVVEGNLVELGPGVTPPVRISGDSATYPERARRMKLRGSVLVSLIVDEDRPADRPAGRGVRRPEILDEVVLKAMRTWRFEPARKDGVRVKVRWQARQTYKTAP